MKILLSPYSQKMPNGNINPKNYPHWDALVKLLNAHELIQIGVEGELQLVPDFRKNLPFREIKKLLFETRIFISVDNFLPHMAHFYGKSGIVIWGQSDPLLFGYDHNINLLKDRANLRKNQFATWMECEYREDVFVEPEKIFNNIFRIS